MISLNITNLVVVGAVVLIIGLIGIYADKKGWLK